MANFSEEVLTIVRSIPSGKVMSYGQIALYLGDAKASRDVGGAMHALGSTPNFPWWRVLNNAGKITIPEKPTATPQLQQQLLEAEGVTFEEPFLLDINRYRYKAERTALEKLGLRPIIIESALEKYGETTSTRSLGL